MTSPTNSRLDGPSPAWSSRTKTVVTVALFVAVVAAVSLMSVAISRLIVGLLLAFIASYPIRALEGLGMKRGLAVGIAYLAVFVVSVGALVLGIPALLASLGEIDWPAIWSAIQEYLIVTLEAWRTFSAFGTTYDLSGIVDPIIDFLTEAEPGEDVAIDLDRIRELLSTGANVIVGLVTLLVTSIVAFFVVVVMALYFSIFLPVYADRIPELAPAPHRSDVRILLARMWAVLDQYAAGMVKVGLFIGVLTWTGLAILGVPGAFSLGVIAGILNIIPTLGPILSGIPGTLVALVQGSNRFDNLGNFWVAVIAVGIYTIVQQVETQLATPRIMGGAVKLSPMVVFLGVIIGLQVAGILGALIAVPLILMVREVFRYVHPKLLDEDPYPDRWVLPPDEQPPPADDPEPAGTVGDGILPD